MTQQPTHDDSKAATRALAPSTQPMLERAGGLLAVRGDHVAAARRETEPASTGMFVALEGHDGAGKTTAMHGAARLLRGRGHRAVAVDRRYVEHASRYVADHLTRLRELIWGEPPDAPYLDLGDEHWVYLQAAWYAAFARCVLAPLTAAGHLALVDTWGHKFLAKLALRPTGQLDHERVRALLTSIHQPDLVIFLHAGASTAASRRQRYSGAETGDHADLSTSAFIAQQERLITIMRSFAERGGWTTVNTSALGIQATAETVADIIAHSIEKRENRPQ